MAVALTVWWSTPSPIPAVEEVTQLTDDGESKQGTVVTDGSRVYFNEGQTGSLKIAQVSVTGGPTATVETRLTNPQIAGLAPDGSSLLSLVGSSSINNPTRPSGRSRSQPESRAALATRRRRTRSIFPMAGSFSRWDQPCTLLTATA
jgi:hypothetical protein